MKLHKAVRLQLEDIARGEAPADWLGFDDADIMWFLRKHAKKSGPGLDWLRSAYQEMLDYLNAAGSGLVFCPVTPDQAAQLLRDINRKPKK